MFLFWCSGDYFDQRKNPEVVYNLWWTIPSNLKPMWQCQLPKTFIFEDQVKKGDDRSAFSSCQSQRICMCHVISRVVIDNLWYACKDHVFFVISWLIRTRSNGLHPKPSTCILTHIFNPKLDYLLIRLEFPSNLK